MMTSPYPNNALYKTPTRLLLTSLNDAI